MSVGLNPFKIRKQNYAAQDTKVGEGREERWNGRIYGRRKGKIT
jgi:hypothetical protein